MRSIALDRRLVTTASQVRIGLDITMGQASFPASSDWRALNSSGGPIPAEYLIPGGVILGPGMFRVWRPLPPVSAWTKMGLTVTMRGLSTTKGAIYFTLMTGTQVMEVIVTSPAQGFTQITSVSQVAVNMVGSPGFQINTPTSSSPVSIELTGLRIAGVPAP